MNIMSSQVQLHYMFLLWLLKCINISFSICNHSRISRKDHFIKFENFFFIYLCGRVVCNS